jgi:hypothetical protein
LAGALQYRDGERDRKIRVGTTAWWRWPAADGSTTFRFEHHDASYTAALADNWPVCR